MSTSQKNTVKGLGIVLGLALWLAYSNNAFAKLLLESEKSKPVFVNASGAQITAIEAVTLSIKGEKILKCTEVEATASDKGNISLKNKK